MSHQLLFLLPFLTGTYFSGNNQDPYLKYEIKEHKDVVNAVTFSPDGRYIVSGGEDKLLLVCDAASGEALYRLTDNYYPAKAVEMNMLNQIFLASGPDIKLIDLDQKTLMVYSGTATHIWSIDYAPERNKIAAGSFDYSVKVWDVSSAKIETVLKDHSKSVLPVVFSPDEKYLATGSFDKTVKLWNAQNGELIRTMEIHTDNIYDVKFHPTGMYLATASRDKTIRLWDVTTGKVVKTYAGHHKGVLEIEFLPDGNHFVSASYDGSIRLWQTKTGKMIYTFTGHEGAVKTIAVSPDGLHLVSGGYDSKVLVWEISKKIFVEYAFYDEFLAEKSESSLFDEKQKSESKSDYEARLLKANETEQEIVEKYYRKYMQHLRDLTF